MTANVAINNCNDWNLSSDFVTTEHKRKQLHDAKIYVPKSTASINMPNYLLGLTKFLTTVALQKGKNS